MYLGIFMICLHDMLVQIWKIKVRGCSLTRWMFENKNSFIILFHYVEINTVIVHSIEKMNPNKIAIMVGG